MTDRTNDVIAAIDGALTDWSVSPDAMRWTPDADDQPHAEIVMWRPTFVPPEIVIDWTPRPRPQGRASWHATGPAYYYEDLGSAIGTYGEALSRAMEAMGHLHFDTDQLAHWAASLAALDAPEPDDGEPETPQARALRMRQQRGTGPARQPAGRQKRPRKL